MEKPRSHRLELVALLEELESQVRRFSTEALRPVDAQEERYSGMTHTTPTGIGERVRYCANLRMLHSNVEKILLESNHGKAIAPSSIGNIDGALLWQIPAYCIGSPVIDQAFVKERIIALQQHRSAMEQDTEDIWESQEIQEWEGSTRSSLILLEGNSQSSKRLEKFSVEMVDHLERTQLVLHILSPLPFNSLTESPQIVGNDILRQVALQCLRALAGLNLPDYLGLLAEATTYFKSDTLEDWFVCLEKSLGLLQAPISIVLNTEVLGSSFRDAFPWLDRFQRLCQLIDQTARLNVMLISARKLDNNLALSVPIVSVVRSSTQAGYRRTGKSHHKSIQPDRTPSCVLSRHTADPEVNLNNHIVGSSPKCVGGDISGALASLEPNPEAESSIDTPDHTKPFLNAAPKSSTCNDGRIKKHSNTCIVEGEHYAESAERGIALAAGHFQAVDSKSLDSTVISWFQRLETTHEVLRSIECDASLYQLEPIKIAVLDTGFAYTQESDKKSLKPYKQRIAKFVNFVDDGQGDAAAKEDPSGHGTAVAVQVLKTSQTAILYICRVARQDANGHCIPDKPAVEKALRKAAGRPDNTQKDGGGWGVDIINMSFGWDYDDDLGVRAGIRFARDNGVQLLASTSNYGLLGPPKDILYPSRADEVIAVDAANGHGEYLTTSASSMSESGQGRRFSAPGLGPLSPNSDKPWSGSSFACAIATGVCALILEFVRQPPLRDSPTMQVAMRDMKAMIAILRLMSQEKGRDGYRFLLPWLVIGVEEPRELTSYIIVKELRREYGHHLGAEIWPK